MQRIKHTKSKIPLKKSTNKSTNKTNIQKPKHKQKNKKHISTKQKQPKHRHINPNTQNNQYTMHIAGKDKNTKTPLTPTNITLKKNKIFVFLLLHLSINRTKYYIYITYYGY